MTLLLIIFGTMLGGVLSVLIAAGFAVSVFSRWTERLVSVAVGVMLGAACLSILPEAAELGLKTQQLMTSLLAGFVAFFVLEKLALWRHDHSGEHHVGKHPAAFMILFGDGIHNFVDGVLIAAAFLTDVKLGFITAAAVLIHEIPQELGDFVILLKSGYSKRQALLLNAVSGMMSVLGGVIGYFALAQAQSLIPYALVIAAASFLYIAIADLVPMLHQERGRRAAAGQTALLLVGVSIILLQDILLHHHH
ncbi:MAG: ZIP family metal transporter [Burkholderiales bacterium]